jgi:phosphatidylserine/phosphatidylglycerophosphate/cardiolipin synthase-like enzyme
MKQLPLKFTLPLLLLSLSLQAADISSPTLTPYFSPNGGCTQAVVEALGAAKSSILVQAYSFTSAPIAKALVDAHRRSVDVHVILDKSQRLGFGE